MGRSLGRSFSKSVDANKLRRIGCDDDTSEEVFEKEVFDSEDCSYEKPDPEENEEPEWREYLDAEGKFTGVRHPKTPDFDETGSPDPDDEDWYYPSSYQTEDGISLIDEVFRGVALADAKATEEFKEKRQVTSAWDEYLNSKNMEH